MTNKIVILFSLILLIIPPIVIADVIPSGHKGVSYCFEISNINKFQDYSFLAEFQHWLTGETWVELINAGDCVSNSRASVNIHAVNSNLVNLDVKDNLKLLIEEQKAIKSNIIVKPYGLVKENDPLKKVWNIFEVVNIDKDNFELKKLKVKYEYEDNTTEEKVYLKQEIMPEPSRKPSLPWWFAKLWYTIIPVTALIILIAVLLIRKIRK